MEKLQAGWGVHPGLGHCVRLAAFCSLSAATRGSTKTLGLQGKKREAKEGGGRASVALASFQSLCSAVGRQ